MPPKSSSKAAQQKAEIKLTTEKLYEIEATLSSQDNPPESAFKSLLDGAKCGVPERNLVAQFIPKHAHKFPSLKKSTMSVVSSLTTDNDLSVRMTIIRLLPSLEEFDRDSVRATILNALGDDDSRVSTLARQQLERVYPSMDKDELEQAIDVAKGLSPASQSLFVDFVKQKVKFDEETADSLQQIVTIAFKCNIEAGFFLMKRNRSIISDESRGEIIADLLSRLERSLEDDFLPITENLLIPIIERVPIQSVPESQKVFEILATHVYPRFSDIPVALQLKILQKTADIAHLVENPQSEPLFSSVFDNAFDAIPSSASGVSLNFSVIEATLFVIYRLGKKAIKMFSKKIAKALSVYGQPVAYQDISTDSNRYELFVNKLNYIKTNGELFVSHMKTEYESAKASPIYTPEEKKEAMNNCIKGKRTGNNTLGLCRALSENEPFDAKVPQYPSWKNKPRMDNKQSNRRQNGRQQHRGNRNQRGGRPTQGRQTR